MAWIHRLMGTAADGRISARRQSRVALMVLLGVAIVALTVALVSAAAARAGSRQMTSRLLPAALSTNDLLQDYTAQQSALRDYVSGGGPARLLAYQATAGTISGDVARLRQLLAGYPPLPGLLAATVTAQRAWLARVAQPQLADLRRGDLAAARARQADIPRTRPYTLAVRSAAAALQQHVILLQGRVTRGLVGAQQVLIGTLLALCLLLAATAFRGFLAVRNWIVSPAAQLMSAADSVAAGHYDTPIPEAGAAETAAMGRTMEYMRRQLVTALAEQEQAEQGFRLVFETAPEATLAVSEDGVITMANAQAVHLFGYPAGELVGQPVDQLVPASLRGVHESHRARYAADPRPRPMGSGLELAAIRRDGSQFPAEVSLSGRWGNGGLRVTAVVRDISERLAMQAEHDRLRGEAQRQQAARRTEQAQRLESLGQLVGGVAHDFNNLLNVIMGYAEFAGEQVTALADGDERLRAVGGDIEQVRSAAEQAARLTRQLLIFARRDMIRPEVLDLNEAVQGAGQLLHRTLGEQVTLTINTSADLWPVEADRGQLEQVLVNLAVNARDAMPGGGTLTIDTGNADVDESYATARPGLEPGRYVRLRVSDTGSGMDQATIDRAFEPFFTTKPLGRGTGLGLATAYGVVTHAGGAIHIYSELGVGTTVSVLLPAADRRAAAPPEPEAAVPPGRGESILVVEDESGLRDLVQRILNTHGYRVRAAAAGTLAVDLARDPALRIDLLLTDMVMPEMLGNEVAARIHETRPELPVLYMTGYAEPVLRAHRAMGPEMDILEKPFTQARVLARVRAAIDGHGRPAGSQDGPRPAGAGQRSPAGLARAVPIRRSMRSVSDNPLAAHILGK